MIIFVSDMRFLIMNINRFRLTYALLGWLLMTVAAPVCAQVASAEQLIYDGIDVSHYQGNIDWEKVASDKNIKFVYIKASEGATLSPKYYHLNIVEIRQAGIPVGAYHFFHPGVPVEKQFKNFTQQVKKEEQDLVPLIDVEKPGKVEQKALADSVKKFADMLEKYYGCRPMIYTGSAFYNKYLIHRFADYPLFIARYSAAKPVLKDGAKWVLWQFTEKGKVDGIKDNVDMSRFNKGCGLANIMMKGKAPKSGKTKRSHRQAQAQEEQPNAASQKPVTKRKRDARPLTKEEEKLQKKRLEAEKKEAERLEKQREKLRKLQEKEAKEAAKQEQKRREKAEKEAKKQAEKRAKEQKKQREDSLKRKEEERKKKQQSAAKAPSEKAPLGKSASAKASSAKPSSGTPAKPSSGKPASGTSTKPKTATKKRTNQSSIDNE
ncbi:MAG: GH25 family lysozyme [Sodaliphilus sp.]